MEILDKLDFIKTQYAKIIKLYNLRLIIESEHYIKLENEDVLLKFSTEKYDPNPNALGLYITGKKISKGWLLYSIEERMGFEQLSFLSKDEFDFMMTLPDGISCIIYTTAIFLERYGVDLMKGDFSIMGEEWCVLFKNPKL